MRIGWSGDAIVTEIINGGISSVPAIPIPKGTTNGDMIKFVFNPVQIIKYTSDVQVYFSEKNYQFFGMSWWNAPYKGNLSEKPTGSESEAKNEDNNSQN